jgi:transposase
METESPLPQAATTRHIQVNNLPDSIPIHIKDALTRCSIPDAVLYDYECDRDAHRYILVEVKYRRDTDPAQQRDRASQQHQVLRETIQKYAPQATYCRPSDLEAGSVRSNLQLNHGSHERLKAITCTAH